MKKVFLPFLITCLIFSSVIAQNRMKMGKDSKPLQRIEQWEKLKLIDALGLNEETALRLFARRHENQVKIKEILDQRDSALHEIEDEINNKNQSSDAIYKDQVNKLLSLEERITIERGNFLKSLNDILTPQQIAKLVVFESRFRRQVRETLMGHGRPQLKD
jgi:Spy/CpxP family protein refolding chaperone